MPMGWTVRRGHGLIAGALFVGVKLLDTLVCPFVRNDGQRNWKAEEVMRTTQITSWLILVLAGCVLAPISVHAQSGNPDQQSEFPSQTESTVVASGGGAGAKESPAVMDHWDLRIGTLSALYHSGATIAPGGRVMPDATATLSNNISLMLDVRRFITKNVSMSLMGGFPPKPTITGKGSVSSFGELGEVRYGPAMLTADYHLPERGAFRPYVGAGAAYAIILKDKDAMVSQLKVHNNWGTVLQAGTEYEFTRKMALFVDFKELWMGVNAHGFLSGTPVKAHVVLDPSIVSVGIRFHLIGGSRARLFSRRSSL